MAMVEPTINYDNFLKDLDDGMSAYNLQTKYVLTPRQYRWIMRRVVRKDGYSRKSSGIPRNKVSKNFNDPYISIKKDNHKYLVRKNKIYYGEYETLKTAREIKKRLTEVNWDKSKLNDIRKSMGLKQMRVMR